MTLRVPFAPPGVDRGRPRPRDPGWPLLRLGYGGRGSGHSNDWRTAGSSHRNDRRPGRRRDDRRADPRGSGPHVDAGLPRDAADDAEGPGDGRQRGAVLLHRSACRGLLPRGATRRVSGQRVRPAASVRPDPAPDAPGGRTPRRRQAADVEVRGHRRPGRRRSRRAGRRRCRAGADQGPHCRPPDVRHHLVSRAERPHRRSRRVPALEPHARHLRRRRALHARQHPGRDDDDDGRVRAAGRVGDRRFLRDVAARATAHAAGG